jgi:hypothetical protein
MNTELVQQLESLFIEAGSAHHRAFIQVNGEDDAWALWYANHLYERLGMVLKRQFEPAQLAEQLEKLEAERKSLAIRSWARNYAESFARQTEAVV